MNNNLITNQPLIRSFDLWEKLNQFRVEEGDKPIRHGDFLARVEDEIDDLPPYESFAHPQNKQMVRYYNLNSDQSLLVGMRESKVVRKKVLKWIKELTKPQIPQSFAEALQLAADQAKQLELAAPKVAFVDNYVESGTTKTLRETAKILHYPERKMIAKLIDDKVLYRQSGNLLPYQDKHEQGLFDVKTGENGGYAFTQTRVTTKGIEWLAQRYASELL